MSDFLTDFPNTHLHATQDPRIIGNMRHCKDVGHFDRSISRYTMKVIESNATRITPETAMKYTQDLKQQILNFNPYDMYETMPKNRYLDFEGNPRDGFKWGE